MSSFFLEIVSPERLAYSEEVGQVSVPSETGQLTVLPGHIPLFANLAEGEVIIRQNGEDHYLAIGGGFLEVTKKKVMILVTRVFKADELNEQAILQAKKDAEDALALGVTGGEMQAAQALLRSTLVDLKVLRRHRRLNV